MSKELLIQRQEILAAELRADIKAMQDGTLGFGQSPDGKKMPRDMTAQILIHEAKLAQTEAHIARMKAEQQD